jgi:hypothetical protein
MGVRLRLTPRENIFYELFTSAANNLLEGAHALEALVTASRGERDALAKRLRDLEHVGDDRSTPRS